MSSSLRPRRSVKQSISYVELSDSASDTDSDTGFDLPSSEGNLMRFGPPNMMLIADRPATLTPDPPQLQTIHFPTQPEIRAAKERISASSSELERVEVRYRALKNEYEAIAGKRSALIKSIEDDKEFISPIRRLPVELLGLVFLFHSALPDKSGRMRRFEVEDDCGSPWTLMHVSRTWRSTALYTRQLWSTITLTSPAYKNLGLVGRRKAGREVCSSAQQFEMALKRVGNGSIDLLVSFSNPFPKQRGRRMYDRRAFRDMFEVLITSGKGSQVKHLELEGRYSLYTEMCPVERWDLRNLETFNFNIRAASTLLSNLADSLAAISRTAGAANHTVRLHSMEIVIPQTRWWGVAAAGRLAFFNTIAPLRTLRHLVFDFQHQTLTLQEIDEFQAALSTATSLVDLELISFDVIQSSNDSQKRLRFPHVRTLILSKNSQLWRLEATSLTHLTLKGDSSIQADGPGVNARSHLPNLTSLTLAVKKNPRQCEPLKDIDFHGPLHTVDLQFGANAEQFWNFMDSPAFIDPVVLKLRKLTLAKERGADMLAEKLRDMHRLEELEIEDVTLNTLFFDQINAGEEGAFPLPSLLKLKIDLEGCGLRGQDRAIKAAAKKFIRRRCASGLQMHFALLRMPGGKGWVDLVE